jgi:hypothetical protein
MAGDYKVGYGKPPRHTRFKKGQSGNPRGRPKGKKNMKTMLEAALVRRETVRVNGKMRRMTRGEYLIEDTFQKAAKGSEWHLAQFFRLMQMAGLFDEPPNPSEHRSGVLVVPPPMTVEEWEKAAHDQQDKAQARTAEWLDRIDGIKKPKG